MANSNKEKKRKRTINTSKEQYELYLNIMENDYIFRSGIINPSVENNYIEKKWDELVILLNAVGDGPQLGKEEWKKRFKDWKNCTRAKYRKIKEGLTATGGGEEIKIKISEIEERGLVVWGKVAVTGTQSVPVSGGLQSEIVTVMEVQLPETDVLYESGSALLEYQSSNSKIINSSILEQPLPETDVFEESSSVIPENESVKKKWINRKRNRKEMQPKPLNEIATNLSDQFTEHNKELNSTLQHFISVYRSVEAEKIKLERDKLEFEIEKYRYENKDFIHHNQ